MIVLTTSTLMIGISYYPKTSSLYLIPGQIQKDQEKDITILIATMVSMTKMIIIAMIV